MAYLHVACETNPGTLLFTAPPWEHHTFTPETADGPARHRINQIPAFRKVSTLVAKIGLKSDLRADGFSCRDCPTLT